MAEQVKDIALDADEGGLEAKIGQATKALRDQLAAKDAETQQLRKVAQDRDTAARDAQSKLMQAAAYATRTEHSAIANALAEADARLAQLKQQVKIAVETADGNAAAELQMQMADLAARRLVLEQGKSRIEEEIEADKAKMKQYAERPPAPPSDPFEAAIAPLHPAQQAWLRQHKDKGYVRPGQPPSDDLMIAYHAARKSGLAENTPQFFAAMDRVLKHTPAAQAQAAAPARAPEQTGDDASQRFEETPPQPQPQAQSNQQARRAVPAAPVSRAAGGAANQGGRTVRLSAAQAQTAERLGMTPQQYRHFQEVAVQRGKLPASALNN